MLETLLKITTWLTIIFSLLLGFYTIYRNSKSAVHRLWFLTCIAVATWCIGYILSITSINEDQAKSSLIIVYIGAILIPIFYYHFILKFLMKDNKTLLTIGYLLALIFLFFNFFTNYLIKGTIYKENFGYYEDVNFPVFHLFLIYFFFYTIYSVYLLVKSYHSAEGIKKKQIFYLLLAAIVGFGGGITNFIMDLTGIYPVGQFFVFLYPILITYGIFMPEVRIRIS